MNYVPDRTNRVISRVNLPAWRGGSSPLCFTTQYFAGDGFARNLPRRRRSCGSTSEPSASAVNFRHRLGPDFADWCGIERRLIIELDGGQHAEQQEQEAARTAYLTAQGYRVIRFWHEQVNRAWMMCWKQFTRDRRIRIARLGKARRERTLSRRQMDAAFHGQQAAKLITGMSSGFRHVPAVAASALRVNFIIGADLLRVVDK